MTTELAIKPQVEVEKLEALDPEFEGGSTHVARATLTNNTAKDWTYDIELYLGVTKEATSGVGSVTIAAGASQVVDFTVTMPLVEGTYPVYLDVMVDTALIKHYQTTEDVTIAISPAITVGPITWV